MTKPTFPSPSERLRTKIMKLFDGVIVDCAGVINATEITDRILKLVSRKSQ